MRHHFEGNLHYQVAQLEWPIYFLDSLSESVGVICVSRGAYL